MAGAAVVGGDARLGEQRRARRRARRRGSRAATGAGARPRAARPAGSPAARSRRRRRRAARGGPRPAAAKPRPSGPSTQSPSPAPQLARAARVPGPTSSSMNSQAAVLGHAQDGERARQERAARPSPAPALGRGEHVELARGAARGRRGRRREHDVGAELVALGARAARRRPNGASVRARGGADRAHARGLRPRAPPRWSSWSESTAGAPWRAAAIARAAASAAGQRRQARDPARDRGAADLPAVGARARAGRGVDDEVDVAALDPVDDVRRALADLVQRARPGSPCARSPRRCRAWRRSGSRGRAASGRSRRRPALSRSVTVMNAVPLSGSARAGRGLRLGERGREVARDAHDLAGRAHLRPEQRVGAVEAVERQHGLLDRDVVGAASGRPAGRGRRSARRA